MIWLNTKIDYIFLETSDGNHFSSAVYSGLLEQMQNKLKRRN